MSPTPHSPPVALTIAGSDSSAGAGAQADLKTFAAHGVYGVNALTAIVAEAPGAVSDVSAIDSTLLTAQLNRVSSSFSISAVKIGMLATAENVLAVCSFLQTIPEVPVVVDPVLRASAGPRLLSDEGVEVMKRDLFPLASLVTPNWPEMETLLGESCEPNSAAHQFCKTFGCDVLAKGGHFNASLDQVTDHAWIEEEAVEFVHPRLSVPDLHGTGCTLSSAIAANLALGKPLRTAVKLAISFLARCMEEHFHWPDPVPSEALNHFPNGVHLDEP